jgi:hypothetical protein
LLVPSIPIGGQFHLVESPRLQILGRDPELIDAFAEVMTEGAPPKKLSVRASWRGGKCRAI